MKIIIPMAKTARWQQQQLSFYYHFLEEEEQTITVLRKRKAVLPDAYVVLIILRTRTYMHACTLVYVDAPYMPLCHYLH